MEEEEKKVPSRLALAAREGECEHKWFSSVPVCIANPLVHARIAMAQAL